MTARLTTSQAELLDTLQDGGYVNRGNSVLVDRRGRPQAYCLFDLAILISLDLLHAVSGPARRWTARPRNNEEEGIKMTDNYHKEQADAMALMLGRMLEYASPRTHESINAVNVAKDLVLAYEKHEATSGRQHFRDFAPMVGADPEWYGHTIEWVNTIGGKIITSRYTITGIDVDKPVNKIILTTSRGKLRTTSVAIVAGRLGEAKAPDERKRAIQL